jgi:hypothetical protein
MLWVILIVAIIIAAFAVPRFGKVVLGLIGILLVLGFISGIVLFVVNQREQAERQAARARIQKSEIELIDLGLGSSYGTGSYKLGGRVRNRSSRYTLTEMRLKFTMRDCAEAGDCEIVGQTEDAMYVNVPPGQARDLNESIYFSGLGRPRGKHQWDYEIVEVLGK